MACSLSPELFRSTNTLKITLRLKQKLNNKENFYTLYFFTNVPVRAFRIELRRRSSARRRASHGFS